MIGATDREDRQLSSPRSSLYRGPAEQPSASPAISASPALCLVPRGSTAAARKVTEVFSLAGIEIGGGRPWDLQVHDQRFYPRLLAGGDLAAGESYIAGWWGGAGPDGMCTRGHPAHLPPP